MEVKFKDVKYIYNSSLNKKISLSDITMNLNEDIIYGITGNSGSGKSTLLQLFNGILKPTYGKIKIFDIVLDGSRIKNINNLRKRVGLVFQFPEEQFFESTVFKEMSFALSNFGYKGNMKIKILNALKIMGLNESLLNKDPNLLSSGEKRKVAIASIICYNPEILILDEPTVGLDYNNKKVLLNVLKKMNHKYKKTIIIVSHDINMLYNISTDIIILKDGYIIKAGKKEEVYKDIDYLKNNNIKIPDIIDFTNKVLVEKGVKLGENNDVKDLIKAVYRNV